MATVVFPLRAFNQPVIEIGEYAGCYNTEVIIPIKLEHFEDVAAITLYIGINTANVEYVGIENVNEVFSTGDFVGGVNTENQIIVLSWASFTAANLESGVMCDLRVLFKNDEVAFNFLDNCEIVRSDLSIVENVIFNDGSLVALTSFTPNPVSQNILEGESATILLSGMSEGISAQWQRKDNEEWVNIENTPPFSGVQTSQLSIQPVSAELNGNLFRCELSNGLCSEISDVSELLVSPNGVEDREGQNRRLEIYPNPAREQLNCIINLDVSFAELRLVQVDGTVLKNKYLGDVVSGKVLSLPLKSVKTGFYILQLFSKGQIIASKKVLRK